MRNKAMPALTGGKLVLLVSALTFLTGCSKDTRTSDINACVAEIQHKASQGEQNYLLGTADSAEERHDKIGGLVAGCMEKLGYRHANRDMTDERCVDDVDFNAYCYRRGT
jgi:hypothetical protein